MAFGAQMLKTEDSVCEEESYDYKLIFKRFKENKVEIASAITKPFPFLMSLRDRDFISEEKFQISRKKCENPDAVRNEMYDILCDLQKDFSLSLLEVIFSPTHLKAYPDLNETVKIFRDVDEEPKWSESHIRRTLPSSLQMIIISLSEAESLLRGGPGGSGRSTWLLGGKATENPRGREPASLPWPLHQFLPLDYCPV
ncbi:A530032D15Rik [Phodopus roborovskii]|uniref:A530032D15Rik protein n=1 Tax=Phodopus roborovskii TaxID=109678 RepID=A0AAU9ZH27_PHORO|nr:A530032D15Rik [Phodopus roborovskii]